MNITIETLVGINDFTLMVYCDVNKMYYFSIINASGKTYTCDSSFPTLSSAKFMGISAIASAAIDRGD